VVFATFVVFVVDMLQARGLTRHFGKHTAVEALSFTLVPGEIFALLGPNGSGKTTTLRMLAGLIAPSSGTIEIDGAPVDRASAAKLRARIGLLTEAPGLWDRLTVRQNLTVYARVHRLASPSAAVDRSLELFDIRERADDTPAELSKGLRQRVALARTLLHDPGIVLLDEPTSGLDPESARDVRELILRLRATARTVLLSTHNLDEVERLANRVALLRTRLVALDTPAALRARVFGARVRIELSAHAERYAALLRHGGADVRIDGGALSIAVDERSPSPVPAIVRRLVEADAEIESISRESPPLEEVYLRLLNEPETRRS
jgi:ABC-2 type transport system ATP-binding protein